MPQSSVLGPLLILLYINDISQHLDSTCRLYADDCILYRNIKSIQDSVLLLKDLHLLEQWMEKWKMSVNKCLVLSVLHKKNPIQVSYFLHNKQLALVNSTKYLGVTIDFKLSLNQDVDNICKKANSMLAFLQRNFNNSPRKVKADLYLIYGRVQKS